MASLQTRSFGPFLKGVVDTLNQSLDTSGMLRSAKHVYYLGGGELAAGPGSEVAITLMDDQGTPAEVTSVCEVVQFGDGVLAVGHSTVTDDCYLYRLDSGLTGWYNLAGGFTAAATATPLATVLWSTMTASPVVHISEMLGEAYITCTNAASSSALSFVTRVYTGSAINDVTADLDGTGADNVYALGTFSFQAHRFIWGQGEGTTAGNVYRPELIRFGGPNGAALDASGNGSFSIGHRVRSQREAVVGACVSGEVAYVGTSYSLWPIVGYGRDTWDKSKPLDDSYGFIGPKCAVNANGTCYYWSSRGPMRVTGLSKPEPLWDAIPATVASVVDPEKLIAAHDPSTDQVVWFYRGGTATGNQLVCAYDIRRDIFTGPARDVGIVVGAANTVNPVTAPNAVAATGPAGAPTSAVTANVTALSATAAWTTGDATASTFIQIRTQGTSTWADVTTVGPGIDAVQLTGLAAGASYEWRAAHTKNGILSSYLGPVAGSQFTTSSTLAAPGGLSLTDVGPGSTQQGLVAWANSGEEGVYTEVYLDDVYQGRANPGEGTFYVSVTVTGSYAAKVRHYKSGVTESAYAGPESATLTYGADS